MIRATLSETQIMKITGHFQKAGLIKVLPIKVPIDLPPVGLITVRGRRLTPSSEQMMACLRVAAQSR